MLKKSSFFIAPIFGIIVTNCLTTQLHCKPEDFAVVYDITSTFVVNQQTIRREVPGFINGASYILSKWTTKPSEAIETDFRNLLASLGTQHGPAEMLIRDPEGRILSNILVQWLAGTQPPHAVIQCISNYAEYDIFRDIARTIFNGTIIAKHTNVNPCAATCVKQCVQLVGSHHLYLIGNWDPNSFVALLTMPHAQSILAYIPRENIFISGLTHLLLPRNADSIFNKVATQGNLPLNHIIFVSNMPYHLAIAQRLGVRSVALLQDYAATMNAITQILHS